MDKSTRQTKGLALFGVCLLAFTAFLDFTIVNTALPYIQKAFKINVVQLQWVANILPIILCMSLIAAGKMGDFFGRRNIFYAGVTIFAAGCLFAGFSPNIDILVFFRGLQGLGVSILFVTSVALISEIYEGDARVRAIAIYGAITGFGLMIGPFLGGVLIGLLDWKWVFWINLPIIAIGLLFCKIGLCGKSLGDKQIHLDWKGLFFLTLGLGALIYGIVQVHVWIILIGAILLSLLIYFDLKTPRPLLYFEIFKDKLILLGALSCALAGIASFVFMFFDPLFLENVRKLSPFKIGFMIAIIPLGQVLVSLSFQRLVKLFGLVNLLFISCISAFLAVFFHFFLSTDLSLYYVALPFFLIGVNWGLSNTATMTAVNQNVVSSKVGEAVGTISTIWNIMGSIFLGISAVIFHTYNTHFMPAFKAVIAFNFAFVLIVLIAAIWIKKRLPTS